MQEESPRLSVTIQNHVMVVDLIDRKLLDEVNIAQLGNQLGALIGDNDDPRIVINFSSVAHMSSSALGMLITFHKRVAEKKGQLRLCCIQPSIYEVFKITRLNEIFTIDQTLAEAMDGLR